ncbi:uncharacterized protein LOC121385983 [Gigantopelta aegis]|uniref:uncharacterized protein LOC121385983 n=1 Tax=Gigantopelta aegis TaxID=1735272 RepID=UPI001B88A9D3|nr:uncharacterized protein LOC121385983 [Gigantopelta aegis]
MMDLFNKCLLIFVIWTSLHLSAGIRLYLNPRTSDGNKVQVGETMVLVCRVEDERKRTQNIRSVECLRGSTSVCLFLLQGGGCTGEEQEPGYQCSCEVNARSPLEIKFKAKREDVEPWKCKTKRRTSNILNLDVLCKST